MCLLHFNDMIMQFFFFFFLFFLSFFAKVRNLGADIRIFSTGEKSHKVPQIPLKASQIFFLTPQNSPYGTSLGGDQSFQAYYMVFIFC